MTADDCVGQFFFNLIEGHEQDFDAWVIVSVIVVNWLRSNA